MDSCSVLLGPLVPALLLAQSAPPATARPRRRQVAARPAPASLADLAATSKSIRSAAGGAPARARVRIGETFTVTLTCAVLETERGPGRAGRVAARAHRRADGAVRAGRRPPPGRPAQRQPAVLPVPVRRCASSIRMRSATTCRFRSRRSLPGQQPDRRQPAMQGRELAYVLPAAVGQGAVDGAGRGDRHPRHAGRRDSAASKRIQFRAGMLEIDRHHAGRPRRRDDAGRPRSTSRAAPRRRPPGRRTAAQPRQRHAARRPRAATRHWPRAAAAAGATRWSSRALAALRLRPPARSSKPVSQRFVDRRPRPAKADSSWPASVAANGPRCPPPVTSQDIGRALSRLPARAESRRAAARGAAADPRRPCRRAVQSSRATGRRSPRPRRGRQQGHRTGAAGRARSTRGRVKYCAG